MNKGHPSIYTRLPLLVFVFFLFFYLFTARGQARGLDETVMFTTMRNAWQNHTLAIDELEPLHRQVKIGDYGAGNHLYSKLPPGNILFAVWLYGLGEMAGEGLGAVLATLTNPILSAITMVLLFSFLQNHFRLRTALITCILIGIGSDWWYQSRGFGSEVGAGLFILATLLATTREQIIPSGITLGLAFLFRPQSLLAGPIWLLNTLCTDWKDGKNQLRILASASITGLFILAILIYNFARFENPLYFGYANEHFDTPLWQGFLYLFFSPGRSIFLYSPVFLFAFPGAYFWLKKDRTTGLAILSTVLLYLCSVALWSSWDGGWSWGSRLLTPVVPLIGVLMAPAIEKWIAKPIFAILILAAAIIGFGIGYLALLVDPLLTLQRWVMEGNVPYEQTLFTVHNSMLALQLREVGSRQPGEIDAFMLRILLLIFSPK